MDLTGLAPATSWRGHQANRSPQSHSAAELQAHDIVESGGADPHSLSIQLHTAFKTGSGAVPIHSPSLGSCSPWTPHGFKNHGSVASGAFLPASCRQAPCGQSGCRTQRRRFWRPSCTANVPCPKFVERRGLEPRLSRCQRGVLPIERTPRRRLSFATTSHVAIHANTTESFSGLTDRTPKSEWQDLNLRPPGSRPGALPGCATL